MPDTTALPDLKLLQLFDVLYSTRSVTRAAEQLGQSQPTVSIWLARLRKLLNDPLFVRTPAGMQATPRAEAERQKLFAALGWPAHQTLAFHWARLVEALQAAEAVAEVRAEARTGTGAPA